MQHTTNYNLNLPEGSDKVDISKISDNFNAIDGIMKGLSDEIQDALYVDEDDPIIPTPPTEFIINVQDGAAMTDPVGAEITAACGQLDYSVGFTTGDSYDLTFELNSEVVGETTETIVDYIYDGNTYKTLYNSYIIDNAEVIGVILNESTGMYEPMLQPANGKTAWWVPEQVIDGQIQNFVITVSKSTS